MPGPDADPEVAARRTVETVWRIESPRLLGALVRLVRDVGLAEELAQEALVAALEAWPREGVPANPGAWLTTTAKRRGIDRLRRDASWRQREAQIALELEDAPEAAFANAEARRDEDIEDDLLRLMFVACHPVLSPEAQVALTLRLLGGLSTPEIARAFLVPEATIAQRIVRAKRQLAEARAPFESPRGAERDARIGAVLAVLYLVFNEGYAASAGEDWMRPQLAQEAMRLGRQLLALAPAHAEAHGLQALMELQASRFRARRGADGQPVRLAEQDRARWDPLLVQRGLALLERAEKLSAVRGPYTLQAGIAACHARATRAEATDWVRIAALYTALMQVAGSPVVALNRAVAMGMAFGPEAALPLLDELAQEPALRGYYLLPAAKAEMLERAGRKDEAAREWRSAAAVAANRRERDWLEARAAMLARAASSSPPSSSPPSSSPPSS
jgi:RNA polymerase sigma factor (sigma-70 family)